MNYLISAFNSSILCGELFELKKGVKYRIVDRCKNCGIVFGKEKTVPYVFDLENPCNNILKITYGFDTYYFLFPNNFATLFTTKFNFNGKEINVSLSNRLIITIGGQLKCDKNVENLNYSHFEITGNLCLIYFSGKRDFVVVLKDEEVSFADYYDECNINENEKYFMCKLNDSLNHGRVCHIKDKNLSTYLVYLDNEDLCLKTNFVPHIFLDCVLAGNYKYCNELFCEDLKVEEEKNIKQFFPEFDFFYPLTENIFILANKNTLAGIFEFSINDNQITNITCR